MNINEIGDQEKSAVLAKLVGWKIAYDTNGDLLISRTQMFGADVYESGNLYRTSRMALAWCVLNWANHSKINSQLWREMDYSGLTFLPPERAMRLWLDKIFELVMKMDR